MLTPSPNRATFSDRLKITSVNVNGYRAREPEIIRLAEKLEQSSILALSDTRLKKDVEVRLEGFNILRNDKISTAAMATAGGVMLAIPKKWVCKKVDLRSTGQEFECIAAIISPTAPGSKPFKLMCIYNHPNHHFPANLLMEFKQITFNNNCIGGFIVGDLNCAHTAFGSRTSNSYGNRLLQLINDEDMIFHPIPSPTYISNASGLTNTLDLVLSDQSGSRLVESCYIGEDIGSDHLPVITELAFHVVKTKRSILDFNKFVEAVDAELASYLAPEDIDEDINKINNIIMECNKRSSRTITQKKRRLPPEIMQNIILRKTIMKNRKKATTDLARILLSKSYNRINKKIQEQMHEIKEKEAASLAERICEAQDTTTMWRMLKRYKNNSKPSEEPDAPLVTPSGRLTENNTERCQEFARYLHSVHDTPYNPIFDEGFKRQIDDSINNMTRDIKTNYIPPINVARLEELLVETKSKSAPGEDLITYKLLKRCALHSKKIFCNLLNKCLEKNVFPRSWKHAKVVMLAKPGRDKNLACNYRPISLLSCLGKMYERYIYAFLIHELDEKKFLNPYQAGFTKKRSAHEHIFRLAQDIENGFKERKCTLGLFLDIRAAFDSVWKQGLKYKINKIGLPCQLENILHSFLDNRTLHVFLDGTWSQIVELRAGTPQGSVLSPILYLIFVNDLPCSLNLSKIDLSQYADDVGLWTTSASAMEATQTLQTELSELEGWCKKWQVSLHPAKSKMILFTKCPRHKEEISGGPILNVFNEQISATNQAEYLGVLFDARMTWEPHTQKLVAKGYKRVNLLRSVAALSKNIKPEIINLLYKAIIRSIFEYGSVCIITAAETHIRKMQLVQNQAVRIMLQTPGYVSVKDLHDCSGLPLIKDHLIQHARKRIKDMERLSPILGKSIAKYQQIRHNKENASCLDIIDYQGRR